LKKRAAFISGSPGPQMGWYILSVDDFGRRRVLANQPLSQQPELSGLNASEGQFYRCPVSHRIPVKNQLIEHPAEAGFFIAFPLCLRSRKPLSSTASPKEPLFGKGTGSPVPKSKPHMRALAADTAGTNICPSRGTRLAPEVRFQRFNLYGIASNF
jgi:hypothetical protein